MKLPIGIQTFSKIREDDYVYIDKTEEAFELIQNYQYVFLSRPRRFGKSLFLDTLQEIFEGNKQYFQGLYIEDKYDFSKSYPVIKISFSGNLQTPKGLTETIQVLLKSNQARLGLLCEENLESPNYFKTLLENAYKKFQEKVVVLIDEYDKPLLDNITNKEMAEHAKDQLKNFYGVIKDNDKYIRFVFITGVSKFSKISIFSGLNNLEDITLNPKFGNICGYTQNDIETTLLPLLQGVDLEELKTWYNGYNFLKDKVYNPFDILLFIRNNFIFENYWFETGTPTFLIKLIQEQKYYLPNLSEISVGKEMLNSFDIDKINIEVLLFQAGYLTIDKVFSNPFGGISYSLVIPNKEIRLSLNGTILNMFIDSSTEKINLQNKAYLSLQDANLEEFKESLISLFAAIPYQNYAKNKLNMYEGFYASVIYAYLASLGLQIQTEVSTNLGRLDMSVTVNNNIYVMEFKTESENALQQIKQMKYYEKFQNQTSKQNKEIYLVGINFDKQKKNISAYEWEKL